MERSLAEQLAEVRRGLPRRDPATSAAAVGTSPFTEDLSEYRELSHYERDVLSWAIRNGGPIAQGFQRQLEEVLASPSCKCGCPSISLRFAIPVESVLDAPRLLVDFFGKVDGLLVGGILWTAGGRLAELEIYELEGVYRIYGLPRVDTLELAKWDEKVTIK